MQGKRMEKPHYTTQPSMEPSMSLGYEFLSGHMIREALIDKWCLDSGKKWSNVGRKE